MVGLVQPMSSGQANWRKGISDVGATFCAVQIEAAVLRCSGEIGVERGAVLLPLQRPDGPGNILGEEAVEDIYLQLRLISLVLVVLIGLHLVAARSNGASLLTVLNAFRPNDESGLIRPRCFRAVARPALE